MKTAVVYHWWKEKRDPQPSKNLRVPLILSIASLRGADPNIPIYVIDGSTEDVNWNGFKEKLNFQVIHRQFWLEDYKNKAGWSLLSRLNDVFDISQTLEEDLIVYSDCDVFWKSSPLPLEQSPTKFCFDRYNSGFFYYDKNSPEVANFFNLFKAYVITALNDENFRIITRQYEGQESWTFVLDETVMYYMSCKIDNLFNYVSAHEHLTPWTDSEVIRVVDFDKVKMMHIHGTSVQNKFEYANYEKRMFARGIAALAIKEFYQNISKVLDEKDLRDIYGEAFDYYLNKQVSLYDKKFIERLLATKKDNELYQFNDAIEQI